MEQPGDSRMLVIKRVWERGKSNRRVATQPLAPFSFFIDDFRSLMTIPVAAPPSRRPTDPIDWAVLDAEEIGSIGLNDGRPTPSHGENVERGNRDVCLRLPRAAMPDSQEFPPIEKQVLVNAFIVSTPILFSLRQPVIAPLAANLREGATLQGKEGEKADN